jgi:predicted nucleotidyltransferase
MSTLNSATVLFGKTQRALLAIFFGRPDESFYLRQIVRMAGGGQGAIQRELKRWVEAGLLTQTPKGNQLHYQANKAMPIFPELKALTLKTCGMAGLLREALAGLANQIVLAFVHGSMASGTEKADSDVDLIVVGDVSFSDVVEALQGAQQRIGREINPSVYPVDEFKKKLRDGHPFLNAVLANAKIFLIGDEDELGRLGA